MSNIHEKTRKVYEAQHKRITKDNSAFNRNLAMYEKDLGVEIDWLKGKKVLDAGCGNIGSLAITMLLANCKEVHCCDVGEDWIEPLKKVVKENVSENFEALITRTGNLLELPYEKEIFDYTSVNGVLIHMNNMDEVKYGFKEAARVTKQDGYLFTSWGPCKGLIQGEIFPAIRNYYRTNEQFREFIDNLSADFLHKAIDRICDISIENGGDDLNRDFLKNLFGEDFSMFMHNFVQAPTWLSNECTPEYVEELYEINGFRNIKRITKFIKRTDIRKYFAPIHYDTESTLSKVLYGEGYPIYIAQKS